MVMSCGLVCRCSLDPVLPWLWRRLVATALIQPLDWEPPYAMGVALKKTKRQKKKKNYLAIEAVNISIYIIFLIF